MAEITRNLVGLAHVRKSLGSTAANVTEKTLQVSACVREFPDGQKNCTCEVAGWDGRIRNLWVQFGMWFWRDLDMHKGFCDSGLEGRSRRAGTGVVRPNGVDLVSGMALATGNCS